MCRNRKSSKSVDCHPLSELDHVNKDESSPDECFPFFLEDDCIGSGGSPSFSKRSFVEPSKRFICERNVDKNKLPASAYSKMDRPSSSRYSSTVPMNKVISRLDIQGSDSNQDYSLSSVGQPPVDPYSRGIKNIQYLSSKLNLKVQSLVP